MITDGVTTYDRVLQLMADGEWHSAEELEEIAYFPEAWIHELEVSGLTVTTARNGGLRVRLDRPR